MNERDEETLRSLPEILEGIVMLDRLEQPNPLTGKHIPVEGGPLDGSTQLNDGTHWQGDDWDPEVDGVRHRYRLGVRIRQGDKTHMWFYKGHFNTDGVLVEHGWTGRNASLTPQHSPHPTPPHHSLEGLTMTAPEVDQMGNTDARLHELVLAHLTAAGVSDAEQQAADFVERVRTGRTNTPPDNDAQLWGATSYELGRTLPDQRPLIVARQLIAILRRVREPHRRTWGPGDELPSPPPAKMADLDWDEWLHQDKAGNGCYRMSSKDRRSNADSIHDYEGIQAWPFLLDAEGPFTEITSTR